MRKPLSLQAIADLHLAELPENIGRRVMPDAVELVTAAAKRLAPGRHSGPKSLRTNIRGKVLEDGLSGVVQATARHAHLIHDGTTSQGEIKPRHAKAFKFYYQGSVIYRRTVDHRGISGTPFLDMARDQSIGEVEDLMRKAALLEIAESVA